MRPAHATAQTGGGLGPVPPVLRPELTETQAALFTRTKVLGFGGALARPAAAWTPPEQATGGAYDCLVDPANADGKRAFATLQQAVDWAATGPLARSGQPVRIGLVPGRHSGPVIVAAGDLQADAPPLAIVGLGTSPQDVELVADIDAQMPGAEYARRYGAGFDAAPAPVLALVADITARDIISTGNTAVLRIVRDDVSVQNLTVRNSYNCDRAAAVDRDGVALNARGQYPAGQHQAVAVMVDGADRIEMRAVHMRSFQDTLYLKSPGPLATGRTLLEACDIEGDVDFIFGQAVGYFHRCTVRSIGARGANCWATAPATALHMPYGFVFDDCDFTHDNSALARQGRFGLGRQWFEGVRATPFGASPDPAYRCTLAEDNLFAQPTGRITRQTLESIGKCVILNSRIGTHINPVAPWDDWNGPGYDRQGRRLGTDWGPRFRPFLTDAGQFLQTLGPWLAGQGLEYSGLDPSEPFLAEFKNKNPST